MSLTKVTYSMIDSAPVSVIDYGADPSGVSDSTTAFANALAASDSIVVPAGTYLVNNLAIGNNKNIQGIGLPVITTTATFGTFRIVSANHDIVIDGIHFTSGDYAVVDRSGVEIGGSSPNYNIEIRNCKFTNLSNGIRVNGSPSQSSSACNFHDNLMEDVSIGFQILGLSRSRISGNTIRYKTYLFRGISVLYADECQITNNQIIGNSSTTVTGVFLYYDGSTGIYANRDNLIANNTIRNIKEEGISLDTFNSTGFKYGGTATSGTNNSLTDSGAAWATNAYVGYYCVIVDGTGKGGYRIITANTSTTLTVANFFNVTPDATSKYVIVAPQFRNKILGNILDNVLREGILLWGSSIGAVVANNSLTTCGGTGTSTGCIVLSGQKYTANNFRGPIFHNIVSNNTIENTGFVGIWSRVYSDGTADYQLQGNIIEGNFVGGSGVGIQLDYTQNSNVKNNTLANNSTAIKLSASAGNSDNSVVGNKTIACSVEYNISQTQGRVEFDATASPITGTHSVGSVANNIAPSAGGTPGWVCTTAGTPGTWKAMANLAA